MQNKLNRAKSKLMLEHPYFGMVATNLSIKENSNISALNFKGDVLEINPEYIEVLDVDEVCTILANASLKQQLLHEERSHGKVKSAWVMASDYAINDILVQNGFKLPPLLNYSSRFDRLSAEEIYQILVSEMDLNEEQDLQSEEILIDNLDYEIFIEQIINKVIKSGEVPEGLERLIGKLQPPKVSWRELLFKYINNLAKIDYSFNPPNKRYLYQGIALPAIRGEMLKIAVAIDTSGSIDEKSLNLFISELEYIMQNFKNYEITLIECDSKIQNVQILTPHMPIIPKLLGGGGTDFREVFEYVESLPNIDLLIYFTDGEGIYPNKIPSFDTLWVLNKDFNTPFGKKIIID